MDREKLEEYAKREYNCSQTVFTYFASDLGLDEQIAIKIATPFERGMFKSQTCGALTAAYICLGLKYGSNNLDQKLRLEEMIHKLDQEFANRNISLKCIELLGIDVNTKEGMKEAIGRELLTSVCGSCISSAIEITEKIMEEYDEN